MTSTISRNPHATFFHSEVGLTSVFSCSKNFSGLRHPLDIRITVERTALSQQSFGLRAGKFEITGIVPDLPPIVTNATLLPTRVYVDTSASSADIESARLDALEAFFKEAPAAFQIATVKAFDFAIVDILGASDTRSEIEKHEAIISALRHRHSLGVTDLAKVRSLFCCLLQNTLHITNISHIHTNKIGIETNWRRGEAASRAHALLFDHRRHSNIWLHRTQLSD